MEKKNNQQLGNFWFGFILGGMAVLALGYFFGTKKGRRLLRYSLDFCENFEENLEALLKEFESKDNKSVEKKDNPFPPLLTSLKEKIRNLADFH